jgi:hypothetical protein
MNNIGPSSGTQEGEFLRPGVHPVAGHPELALVVFGERGESRILPRTCPHGTGDLVEVGMVNVTTRELMCLHSSERWQVA